MERDIEFLVRDKYNGDPSKVTEDDRARLARGEPLAYVIGWIPFLGVRILLDEHPLIPRPETEWWVELLVKRIGTRAVSVLDLCAGSGAIGLAVLAHCPNAHVAFGDVVPEYKALIERTIKANALDASRATIRSGDLFTPFADERFDIIAINPPYIPESRALPLEVRAYEPPQALFAGPDGLDLIRRVAEGAAAHLNPEGELWLEADINTIEEAATLLARGGASRTAIKVDLYGRERLVLAYY